MAAEQQEQEWIRQSREGHSEAFEALVRQHQRMIHGVTYRMTGSVSDSEDLAQETFIRAWAHLDSYSGASKFSTWLCGIAIHACLNWRRRENRRDELHSNWSAEIGQSSPGADGEKCNGDLNARVQQALSRLPAKQRAAITLTVYQEMNHADAAKALGCTEATVSWRIFAARRKLRKWLNSRKVE
jgi:RNA polymerase sigma-70 factor (ECF subfamily)